MKHLLKLSAFLLAVILISGCSDWSSGGPARIIFDTDMGPGYDDVGALAMLHAMEANRECKILATVANNRYEGIASVIDVFNTYWGKSDIAIGLPRKSAPELPPEDGWIYPLLKKYPHSISNNQEAGSAVSIYRQMLSIQPDTSVTIVSVGFLSNLSDLLNSTSDRSSPLDGIRLVKKKVKLLVCMGGEFPQGREFNLYNDIAASANVIKNWPSPIIFTGAAIGEKIFTGIPLIENATLKESPVQDAYRYGIENNEEMTKGIWSWDQTAALIAVKGVEPFFNLNEGRMILYRDGSNGWNPEEKGHSFVTFAQTPEEIGRYIDSLMMITPQ